MGIGSKMPEMLMNIDKTISELLQGLIFDSPEMLSPLIREFSNFVLRPGKRIRPLLLILTYLGYSKDDEVEKITESVYKLAAILEIMHAFLLVHDDVIDESTLRRGEPTLHKIYEKMYKNEKIGKDLAIIVGDIASFYYFGKLSELEIDKDNIKAILKLFSECYVKTGYGQLLDILYTGNISHQAMLTDIPTKISLLKTSYYTFVYPMIFGYYLSGTRDDEEVTKLRLIGEKIGIAFQYRDDILGTFGGEAKSANDITEGKYTILIKKTYDLLNERERETFLNLVAKKDVEGVQRYIVKSGALERTKVEITKLMDETLSLLAELKMKEECKMEIERIISKIKEVPGTHGGGMNG